MSPFHPPGSEWEAGARAWPSPPPSGPQGRWSNAAIALAVVIAILGLVVLAGAVVLVASLAKIGGNK